jgi:hypothetical protein
MRALYFTKRWEPLTQVYIRCGVCKVDASHFANDMVRLMLGNDLLAHVCESCAAQTSRAIAEIAPHSFPDLDAVGNVLE